jgi:hypothetical protein
VHGSLCTVGFDVQRKKYVVVEEKETERYCQTV